jgi:ribosomal protein L7/L12
MNTELEAFISQLKREGNSKIASIVKVASAYKLGMDAAKKAVHGSAAWAPEKASHEEFQRQLGNALGESDTEPPTTNSPLS